MVVNTLKFLSRLNTCWPVLVYSVAENGGAFQHQGTHAHTGIETPPFAGFLAGVAEVGGFFGDESSRGLIKADLTNSPIVNSVMLEFKVADMSASGYDVNDTANGGVFGQSAFVGELRIVLYTPTTGIEDVGEFAVADSGTVHTFAANALAVGSVIQVDVTTEYNAAVGGWIGFRIEDTEAVLQTRRDAGAVVFDGACLKLQLAAPNTSVQRMGLNVGLSGGNAGWARWLKDMGPLTSFYVANGASGVISASTGLPTSGDTKLTISTKVGTIFEAGNYTVSWTGTATSGGQASERTVAFAGESVTLDFLNGSVTSFSVVKDDATPGQFADTFLARVTHGECLRLMESQRVNEDGGTAGAVYDPANPYVRIRTVAGANTFSHRIATPELLAALSTAADCDIWYCFHHRATDANVTDFVGRLAYAGFTKTLYVEYSNEIWNTFPQGAWIENEAVNNSGGIYSGAPGTSAQRQAYYADRSDKIAELAKAGYGNVRGVLASQLDIPNFYNNWIDWATRPLTFIDDVSVSWYFGGPPARALDYSVAINYTASQLAALGLADWNDRVKGNLTTWKSQADSSGWGFNCYEGGSHFDRKLTGTGKDPDRQAQDHFSNLSQSTEVAAVHATVLDDLKATYGDPLAMLFQDIGDPIDPWSWLGGELVTSSSRWQEFITRA